MHQKTKSFYKTNLALLKKHHPQTWETITKSPPEPVGHIVPSPKGKPNLTVTNDQGQTVFLHDQANPEKEKAEPASGKRGGK